jgi:hypothetical protein
MDRIEIAKIFWQMGEVIFIYELKKDCFIIFHIFSLFEKHQICSALFASFLFEKMSKKIHDEAKIEFKKHSG